MNEDQQAAIITLTGEDGQPAAFQMLDTFDFEAQEYVLLVKVDGSDQGSLMIMKIIQREGKTIFQMIESEEQFNRVVAFVEKKSQ
jgi:uncharacterized protein YrzB (UPF0473 family)